MRKADLQERLEGALALLAKVEKERRASRAVRDEIEAFTTDVAAALDRTGPSGPKLVRLTYCRSQRTGRYRTIAVNRDGRMGAHDARLLGREDARTVDEWTEVETPSGAWSEATAALAAGGGVRVARNGAGELTRTPGAPPAPKPADDPAPTAAQPKPKARKAAKGKAAKGKAARKGKKGAK